ncbi:hypothetical protein C6Y45_04950 [Alkalicoccus saliphilus]|uniref:Uncharacterized protein n=1 Tax=Alkalicoccus saliphilus TaxID=200989 RepID=A0A2T4U8E0_9BACI|nr:hypothetical protein C6Y45_04950 [Alkalicoccus saliphilus]
MQLLLYYVRSELLPVVEKRDWRTGRSLPEKLLHDIPVESEVFLQPSTNIALNKKTRLPWRQP